MILLINFKYFKVRASFKEVQIFARGRKVWITFHVYFWGFDKLWGISQ